MDDDAHCDGDDDGDACDDVLVMFRVTSFALKSQNVGSDVGYVDVDDNAHGDLEDQ